MDENTTNRHYAIKVRMKSGYTYSVGPYSDFEEAKRMASDIAFGDVNAFGTQRGTTVFIAEQPEATEIMPFEVRN